MPRPNPIVVQVLEQAIPFEGEITTEKLRAGLNIRLCTRTVCRALQELVATKRVTFEGEMGKRRYRRLPQQSSEVA